MLVGRRPAAFGGGLLLAVAAILVVVAANRPIARPWTPPPSPTNFVIVVVDTLRYDATSMGGQPDTPFIDAVARSGVSFARAYSTHDATPKSHFSLFTGLRDGLGSSNDRPDMSLAYQFRERGYDTFGVAANGSLSQTSMICLKGFSRYACPYDEWARMTPTQHLERLPPILSRLRQYGARENAWNVARLYCSGPEVLARWRTMVASAREPFFGFVNIIEPHDPYLPSAEALGPEPASADDVDADVRFRALRFPLARPEAVPDAALRASIARRIAASDGRAWSLSDDLRPSDLATYRRRYQASVRDADRLVQSLLRELEQRGLLERTWVVIVSDHGEAFGEGGFVTHWLSDLGDREATFHVPMVWAPPARAARPAAGTTTVDDDVSLADVAPTIYDLAGIDWTPLKARAPDGFGRSLVSYLMGGSVRPSSPVRVGGDLTDSDRQQMREDALRRLRALGYIR